MDNEVKHSLIWAVALAVFGVSLTVSIAWRYVSVDKDAIAAGMEQRTLPGQVGVYWVKPDQK